MEILKVAFFTIISLFLIIILKDQRRDIAILLSIISGIIILIFTISKITPVINLLNTLAEKSGINEEFFKIILKVTLIAYIIEITKSICEDAEENALAKKIELTR